MNNESIIIKAIICTRCNKKQYPQLNSKTGKTTIAKYCLFCKSPYYQKPIQRPTTSNSSKHR